VFSVGNKKTKKLLFRINIL